MAINFENWKDLTTAVVYMPRLDTFLGKNFFSKEQISYSGTLVIEEEEALGNGVASVVLRDGKPIVLGKKGKATRYVELPETAEQYPFSVKEFLEMKELSHRTVISEGGQDNRISLFNAEIAKYAKNLKDRTTRLFEMLCAKAIVTGAISATYGEVEYSADFGYVTTGADKNKNYIALSGDDLWSASTADPYEQLIKWMKYVQNRSGMKVTHILMGSSAIEAFRSHTKVLAKLNNLNYAVGQLKPFNAVTEADGASFFTTLPNGVDIYEYAQPYTDANGVSQEMFDPKHVVAIAKNGDYRHAKGVWYQFTGNGATMQLDSPSINYFASTYIEPREKRSGEILLRSKEMPLIVNPKSIISVKVLT